MRRVGSAIEVVAHRVREYIIGIIRAVVTVPMTGHFLHRRSLHKREVVMQKGLGIAALVIAIIAMFVPFLGTWLTILVGIMAAFAYGPGIALAIASIILNVVHIFVFSPLLWATQGLAELGAQHAGQKVAFLPWVLIVAQVVAIVILIVLHSKHKEGVSQA